MGRNEAQENSTVRSFEKSNGAIEMKTPKEMAVDAMVKYADNEEIYQLAKALEEALEHIEGLEANFHVQG